MARLPYDPVRLGRLIADVWDEPELKSELLKRPEEVLERAGVRVGGNRIKVHEDTESTIHIVIPRRPPSPVLNEEYLREIGNGMLMGCGDRPIEPK
jgi:hypothetical protein